MESLWEVPPTWQWSNIGKFGYVVSGGTPSTKIPGYWGGDIIWFAPSDLTGYKQKFITRGTKTLTEEGLARSSAKLLPAGSVMFSSRAPIGYVAISAEPFATNQGFKSVVPHCGLFNEYLYHYLKSAKHIAEEHASGTTFKELSGSAFSALPVPIAPTNEQRRIVEKIEALFAEIDKGVESLKAAKSALELYRKSLLKSAFEGHLTAAWRERNPDKIESPEALLARIRDERERDYQAAFDEWKCAVREWEEDGKQGKRPPKPTRLEDEDTCLGGHLDVPDTWTTVPLREVVLEAVLGKMLDREKNRGTPRPYLGNINVRWGSFELDRTKRIPIEDVEIYRYGIRKRDLIVCEGGEPGRCAVWEGKDDDVFVQKALHRVRFTASYSSLFAYYFFRFAAAAKHLDRHCTGSTIKHLTGKALKNVPIPVCSVAEQAEIVRILDSHLYAAKSLETEIDTALARADALRQSILKKAFAGKLVPQDPTDEPAQALLARIRASRDGDATAKPRKSARRRARVSTPP